MTIKRTGRGLTSDLRGSLLWCGSMMSRDLQTWCVRRRETGMVVTFVAGTLEEVGTWLSFDEEPLDNFTLTPMEPDPEAGARFGVERDWRGGLQH